MNTVVIKQEPADTEFESKMTVLQPPHRNDVSNVYFESFQSNIKYILKVEESNLEVHEWSLFPLT